MAKKKESKVFDVSKLSNMIESLSEDTSIIIDDNDNCGFIDTSVFIMNALFSTDIKGGVPDDRISIFAGEPSTGKSYLLYNIARNAQKQGFFVMFIDTEHSVNKQSLRSFGIETDNSKLKLVVSNRVEDLKIFLTKFLDQLKQAKQLGNEIPKILILLDSIGQLASDKEIEDAKEGKNKQDMTRAKAIKQMFRIINADLGFLRIPMICTNHVYADTTAFFPVPVMAGGKGAEYSASTIVFLSTAKLKTGREDDMDLNSTGVTVTAQAKKNRMAKPKKIKFEIDHEYGTNPYKGLEHFCTIKNFDTVGIANGKKIVNPDGTITIQAGGNYWYVRHLDKSMYEKQLFSADVFTDEVLESLRPLIKDYFSYTSYDEQQKYLEKMDADDLTAETFSADAEFESLDAGNLFG